MRRLIRLYIFGEGPRPVLSKMRVWFGGNFPLCNEMGVCSLLHSWYLGMDDSAVQYMMCGCRSGCYATIDSLWWSMHIVTPCISLQPQR